MVVCSAQRAGQATIQKQWNTNTPMHYKTATAWIFAILMLIVFLLFISPTPFVIGLGVIGLPVMILIQAIVVLRAKDESRQGFSDEQWYEDKEK